MKFSQPMEKKKKKFTIFSDGWTVLKNQVQTPKFSPKTPLFSPKPPKEKTPKETKTDICEPELETKQKIETPQPMDSTPIPKIRSGKIPKEEYVSFMFKEMESPRFVEVKEKELEIFQDLGKKEFFKTYCMEKQLTDQFLFYELYQQFKTENDQILKDSISEKLKTEFIDPSGLHVITISASDFKKIQKNLKNDPLKGFQMIYRFVG
jgi:hypothetical protein